MLVVRLIDSILVIIDRPIYAFIYNIIFAGLKWVWGYSLITEVTASLILPSTILIALCTGLHK